MNALSSNDKKQLAAAAERRGLYRSQFEHDACGMGFVAHIKGKKSHGIIEKALTVLDNLTHRGAAGSDPESGDGAGILIQVPHDFLEGACEKQGFSLPAQGRYAVGMLFMQRDQRRREKTGAIVERVIEEEGQEVLGWRDVPVNVEACGSLARETMPSFRQVFVGVGGDLAQDDFEKKLYLIRRRIENEVLQAGLVQDQDFYVCSFSSRTVVYKGLLMAYQFPRFFHDLADPKCTSGIAMVHSRFSTNTMPAWHRAHPFRYIVHNGEINTVRGNVNWMRAREKQFYSETFGLDTPRLTPIHGEGGSDSEMFDNALELLVQTGRWLPHAAMMMVPEAWQKHDHMSEAKRAFYKFHACLMEPWDGPASIAFCDGNLVGAVLDRNGLRPSRYVVTKDDLIIMGSEVGALEVEPENVALKSRLQPGRMLLVDTVKGKIVSDEELKLAIATQQPYKQWLDENLLTLAELPPAPAEALPPLFDGETVLRRQKVFGYTREDVRTLIRPMAVNGEEAIGSMGNDTPLAVLSDKPQLLFSYFRQLFAQVTNPPIDPLREDLVMSIAGVLGRAQNLFTESPDHCRQLWLEQPILKNEELQAIKGSTRPGVNASTLPILFDVEQRGAGLKKRLNMLCMAAEREVDGGATVLILSDRGHDAQMAPIPSLLAVGAVHHHLIRAGKRTLCGLIIETGEAREVMHMALLLGYGAGAINPYLALETVVGQQKLNLLRHHGTDEGIDNYIKACGKGLRKVMSKMGISTLQSYCGAQIFQAIGIHSDVIDRYFTRTVSHIEGVGLEEIAAEVAVRHHLAYNVPDTLDPELAPGGQYQWRRRGEYHMYNPETIASMQHAVRSGNYKLFKKYTRAVDEGNQRMATIRGLLEFKKRKPVPLEEVETAEAIVRRFKTGAMSLGSISKEAHENLAVAMNRIGARSNTGEGGEDAVRYVPDENGDLRRSSIKQVASGRFGVTSHYLVNSDEIQIKMAQGAKPGEGGQLPGHKVDDFIARIRHSTPGVGLISPPPHHDIYSIEDLAQLIHDLKNANDRAAITVKLVSVVGVGTVAAGVSKAKADLVLISGDSGGTGASPLTSIKHAGAPWELGLAEVQQTLVLNDLRSRIRVETDGQLKTGRDVAIAALLGAEEFGFGTSALVASGCILMRVCHLNTCPVGVATQDPELRKRFTGTPDHVINFMLFVAQELREVMAELGFRTVAEMVGRVDVLEPRAAIDHWKAKGLDLSPLLHKPNVPEGTPLMCVGSQDHGLEKALDQRLLERAAPALERQERVSFSLPIHNVNRAVCTMLSSEVSRRYGAEGLPPETINITFHGSAGQSLCAFMAEGLNVRVEGDANDYVGKGLSGGRLVITPPLGSDFPAEENTIAGNVVLYGATGGEVFLRGRAGERFCVRNSGATAVVEGVGDHGCEYMTGGRVVVLGSTGRNFAAGMSGGIAYVYDLAGSFSAHCNTTMVDLEKLDDDAELVKHLIVRHVEYTGSTLGRNILETWPEASQRFVRVMPREFRKVMQQAKYDTEFGALATGP